jgi:hypothetical protein
MYLAFKLTCLHDEYICSQICCKSWTTFSPRDVQNCILICSPEQNAFMLRTACTDRVDIAVAHQICIRKVASLNPDQGLAIVTKVLRSFLQGQYIKVGHDSFLTRLTLQNKAVVQLLELEFRICWVYRSKFVRGIDHSDRSKTESGNSQDWSVGP